MGYQKAVVKYLQTWIQTLTQYIQINYWHEEWLKVSCFIAQQNEVILKKARYS